MSSGIANGGSCQPIASRVAATSLAPSAAPCASAVPALSGAPRPITVLQQMSVGLPRVAFASRIAASTAATSWPSTPATTCQPYAAKRAGVSSVNQFFTSPSIEMPLSS